MRRIEYVFFCWSRWQELKRLNWEGIRPAKRILIYVIFTSIYVHTLDRYIIKNNRIFGNTLVLLKQKEINSTSDCSLSRAVIVTLFRWNWVAQWCQPVCKNQVLAAMCGYICMFWFTLWSDFSFLKILFALKDFPREIIGSQWQIIVWHFFFIKRTTAPPKIPQPNRI